jgi:hypothetical protein
MLTYADVRSEYLTHAKDAVDFAFEQIHDTHFRNRAFPEVAGVALVTRLDDAFVAPCSIAYVSIRQHPSASVSIRQHTYTGVALVTRLDDAFVAPYSIAYVSIRQHP